MESKEINQKISQIIDAWVNELINSLINYKSIKSTGLWDKFKWGVSNLFNQKDSDSNQYKWRNKFGDLGVQENFNPSIFTLKEYCEIKSIFENAEKTINEAVSDGQVEKLKIVQIIKQASEKLKNDINNFVSSVGSKQVPYDPGRPEDPSEPEIDLEEPEAEPDFSSEGSDKAEEKIKRKTKDKKQILDEAINSSKAAIVPDKNWLFPSGKLNRNYTALAIAWMAKSPQWDITSDKKFKEEFSKQINSMGIKFSGLEGSKDNEDDDNNGTLIKTLKRWFPLVSREAFTKTLEDLGVETSRRQSVVELLDEIFKQNSQQKSVTEPAQKSVTEPAQKSVTEPAQKSVAEPAQKSVAEPAQKSVAEPAQKKEPRKSVAEPAGASKIVKSKEDDPVLSTEDKKKQEILKSLYQQDGVDLEDKEKILEKIKIKLVKPLYQLLKDKGVESFSLNRLKIWWSEIESKIKQNTREDSGSVIRKIQTEAILKEIVDVVSEPSIKTSSLLDIIENN